MTNDITVRITGKIDAMNWTFGIVGGVPFEAKIFDEPSKYGINKGRISKLYIKDVCSYDRGWNEKPHTKRGKELLRAVLEQFAVKKPTEQTRAGRITEK